MSMVKVPKHIIEILDKTASRSNQRTSKMAAIFVDENWNVYCRAFNYNLPRTAAGRFSVHAEEHLLVKWRGTALIMVIYRKVKKNFVYSRPCPLCMDLIKKATVPYIIYQEASLWIKEKV